MTPNSKNFSKVNKMSDLYERYPELEECAREIEKAKAVMIHTFKTGNKILVCGNGGSACDAEHIVGELMKGFKLPRKVSDEQISPDLREKLQGALPVISLNSQTGLMTAIANDVDADMIFAQQVYGYAKDDDVVIGISTSGNSKNVVNAIRLANDLNLTSIVLTGKNGGMLKDLATVSICVPATETYRIQEYHLAIYHHLCAEIEKEIFE